MGSSLWRVVVTVFFAISLLLPGGVFADANDLAKQANKIIRSAERKMHSGKNQEAATMLQEAAQLLEQGKTEDPANSKVLRTEKNLLRVQKTIDRKLGKTVKKMSSSRPAAPKRPRPKAMVPRSSGPGKKVQQPAGNKLSNNVKSKLAQITVRLKNAESILARGGSVSGAKHEIKSAGNIFKLIDDRYTGKFDPSHPDYVAVKNHYDTMVGKVNASSDARAKEKSDQAAGKLAREKQSAEWVPKFQAYLSYPGNEGHNPATLVFIPGTSEPEKFEDAKKRYEAFKKFYQEYQATKFPNGRTWKLEGLADKQAPMRLKDFEKGFASRLGSASERAVGEINQAMAYLKKDNGWQSDKSVKPNLLDSRRMAAINGEVQKAVTALGANSAKAGEIKDAFNSLVAKDKKNRQIRKERTFMKPDVYTGSDIKSLKKKAEDLVKKNKAEGGKPLRSTIIAENWREETVHEWTDTSRTVRRWRTTRHQTAQVAAKTTDGFRLITVALAQDKQSNGKWGALYGNLHQTSEPMLKSNIHK